MGNRTAKISQMFLVLFGCLHLVSIKHGVATAHANQGDPATAQRLRIDSTRNGSVESPNTEPRIKGKQNRAKVVDPVSTAATTLSGGIAAGTNDLCANQQFITGTGTFLFDNTNAAKDGPNNTACVDPGVDPVGTIDKDLWYCWRAPCTGPVKFDTCGLTGVDTKIAVYEGCGCPVTEARMKECNDDGHGCGLQSSVGFAAVSGQSYMLRLGVYPGNGGSGPAPGGTGQFRVTCVDLPCETPAVNCQSVDVENGVTSDRTHFTAADNYTPSARGTQNGTVSLMQNGLCWWGSYASNVPSPDTFVVTIYADAGAYPGAIIGGPFRQDSGTLSVTGPVDIETGIDFPVFEYSATHAPVAVTAGECYWLEITNAVDGSQTWYWQWGIGGDGTARSDGGPFNGYGPGDEENSDLAFCLNLPLGDVTNCPAPTTAACAGAMGGCCGGLSTPACGNQGCCDRVCACDPFCCRIAWDAKCAGVGGIPGCGAALLCGDLCEAPFDADGDGDVDLDDFAFLVDCLAGPEMLTRQQCLRIFDFDEDGDIDEADLAAFFIAFGI